MGAAPLPPLVTGLPPLRGPGETAPGTGGRPPGKPCFLRLSIKDIFGGPIRPVTAGADVQFCGAAGRPPGFPTIPPTGLNGAPVGLIADPAIGEIPVWSVGVPPLFAAGGAPRLEA